jgi:hypothetical protein
MSNIEEALTDLRSARELLNSQLLGRRTLRDLVVSAPPEEMPRLKAAYVVQVTDTMKVLNRVSRAIDVLEEGATNALEEALLCLKGAAGENDAPPVSATRH